MRAGVIGVLYRDNSILRDETVRAISMVTHTHPAAIDGARVVANLAAACARSTAGERRELVIKSLDHALEPSLKDAIESCIELAERDAELNLAAAKIGTSGYVLHSVPFALYCFLRFGDNPKRALTEAISAGGDTDTIAAILGCWLGACHGIEGLPRDLVQRIHDGPFGPSHLMALGNALASAAEGTRIDPPRYSPAAALARNVCLFPVVLAHGFRRLLP